MWLLQAAVAGLVEPVDTTLPMATLLNGYGFVVAENANDRVTLRSLPWVFPQSGSAPGDTGLLPTPSGPILLYDANDGFKYASRPDVTLDELMRFAQDNGA